MEQVLLMWMAASVREKEFDYYSDGALEVKEAENLKLLAQAAAHHEYTVGELYSALSELSASRISRLEFFPILIEFLQKEAGHSGE